MRGLGSTPNTINIDYPLRRRWVRRKKNGIQAGWQEDAFAWDSFTERLDTLTVIEHDHIELLKDPQEVTMAGHLPYPELVDQTNRGLTNFSPIANRIDHEQVGWGSAHRYE